MEILKYIANIPLNPPRSVHLCMIRNGIEIKGPLKALRRPEDRRWRPKKNTWTVINYTTGGTQFMVITQHLQILYIIFYILKCSTVQKFQCTVYNDSTLQFAPLGLVTMYLHHSMIVTSSHQSKTNTQSRSFSCHKQTKYEKDKWSRLRIALHSTYKNDIILYFIL